MVKVTILVLALVSVLAWLAQWVSAGRVEAQVARSLSTPRTLRGRSHGWRRMRPSHLRFTVEQGRAGTDPVPPPTSTMKVGTDVVSAFDWTSERAFWDERATHVRRSFLERTQETAEKWRGIFSGLLAVFGAVLVLHKPGPRGTISGHFVGVALVFAISLAVHAVAYTGWAAAGLPKMLVDLNAETAFETSTRQACRCLVRLRIGILCGGLTAVCLTLAFGASLA